MELGLEPTDDEEEGEITVRETKVEHGPDEIVWCRVTKLRLSLTQSAEAPTESGDTESVQESSQEFAT